MTQFFILLALAIVISFIPVINRPFKMIETFFHELSHGLAAVITFGKIHDIKIRLDGSGFCTTSGGWRHLILLAGYAGASSFGFLIYYIGTQIETNQAEVFLYSMMIFFIFVTLMWVRNLSTLFLMVILGLLFYFPLKHELFEYTSMYLKFLGIFICLNSIKSPLYLIDGQDIGDGAELFKITLLPEGVWIVLWFSYGLYLMYNIYLLSVFLYTPATTGI
jgi:hypothetical protein